jgi:hypothetical protein
MKPLLSGNRRFSLGVLVLTCTLGLFVLSQSMGLQRKYSVIESEPDSDNTIPWKEIPQLRWSVITDKTEYKLGEEIIAECVVVSDLPYPVKIKPPVNMGATSYSEANPDEKLGQAVSITWAESEIEIPPNSTVVITSFHFRCDEVGGFVINIHGFPETRVLVGIPPAWIIATRLSTVSSNIKIINVTSEDLIHYPAIMNAIEKIFEEDNLREQGTISSNSDRSMSISVLEVKSIVSFFGEEVIENKKTYEYHIRFAEDIYSILIRLEEPFIVG